jgi:hypothetical protein
MGKLRDYLLELSIECDGAQGGIPTGGIPTYGHSRLASDVDDVRAHGKDERVGGQVVLRWYIGPAVCSPDGIAVFDALQRSTIRCPQTLEDGSGSSAGQRRLASPNRGE